MFHDVFFNLLFISHLKDYFYISSKSWTVVNEFSGTSFSLCLSLCPHCTAPIPGFQSIFFLCMCGDGKLGFYLKTAGQHSISRPDSQQDLSSQFNRGRQLIITLHPFAPGLLVLSYLFDKSVYSVVQIIANMCLLFWEKVEC